MNGILYYITIALIYLNGLLGAYLLASGRLAENLRPIAWAVIISAIEELIALYFAHVFKDNITVYFVANPLDYAAFAWFFYVNIDYPLVKKFIKLTVIAFLIIVISVLYFYIHQSSLTRTVIKDYEVTVRGLLLVTWSVIYVINIFDNINRYKKLNVFALLVTAGILFYYSYTIILFLSEIYLFNYSANQHIPLTEMFSAKNTNMYASKQYQTLRPLKFGVICLFYLCLFIALIRGSSFSRKPSLVKL